MSEPDVTPTDASAVTHERARAASVEPTDHERLLIEEARRIVRPCAERVVKRYWRFFSGGFMSLDDLLSLGTLALHDAVRGYREEQGYDFSVYARRWVEGAMLNALSLEGFHERVRRAADKAESHFSAHHRDDDYDVSRHDQHEGRRRYRAFANGVLAATFTAGVQEAMRALEEDEAAERREYEHALRVLVPALRELAEDERRVLLLVYGEHNELTDVARLLGVAYIRVRRTHARALARLREALVAHGVQRAPRPTVLDDSLSVLTHAPSPGNDAAPPPVIGPPEPR